MLAVLLFNFTVYCLPSSSVSYPYLNLAVPMRKCSGEHSCMSFALSHAEWNLLFSLYLGRLCFGYGILMKCLGKQSCMSSSFHIAILNGTCFVFSLKALKN